MPRRHSQQEKDEVLELVQSGMRIVDIVERTGVPRPTIYRWIYAHGIDLGPGARTGPKIAFDRAAIREMFDRGATGSEVAEKFGCSVRYAYAVKNGELE